MTELLYHTDSYLKEFQATVTQLVESGVVLDLQADGGAHVANTREVGAIRVVGHESKGRINVRLHIAIGP
jgi:Ser-tRNA(Ala) deacylase AlaX